MLFTAPATASPSWLPPAHAGTSGPPPGACPTTLLWPHGSRQGPQTWKEGRSPPSDFIPALFLAPCHPTGKGKEGRAPRGGERLCWRGPHRGGWPVTGWLMEPALERERRSLPHRLRRPKGPGLLLRHGLKDTARLGGSAAHAEPGEEPSWARWLLPSPPAGGLGGTPAASHTEVCCGPNASPSTHSYLPRRSLVEKSQTLR